MLYRILTSFIVSFFIVTQATADVDATNSRDNDLQTASWKLEMDKEGVKVYTSKVKGSGFKAFKGIARYEDVTLSEMASVIGDMENFKNWMHNAIDSKVVKTISETAQACYFSNEFPVVKPRHGVFVQDLSQDPESLVVTIKFYLMNELLEQRDKFVKVDHLHGEWKIEPIKTGGLELTYETHFEPGGFVPGFVANMLVLDTPYKTLLNLREQLTNSPHKGVVLSYVKNRI